MPVLESASGRAQKARRVTCPEAVSCQSQTPVLAHAQDVALTTAGSLRSARRPAGPGKADGGGLAGSQRAVTGRTRGQERSTGGGTGVCGGFVVLGSEMGLGAQLEAAAAAARPQPPRPELTAKR